jgi:uncharacterized protein YndB with AHSA1/START domain
MDLVQFMQIGAALERWWGPPTHPATFEKHDVPGRRGHVLHDRPGGTMWGAWRVRAVDPPTSLEFINAFADTDGTPVADMPVFTVRVRLIERDGGTRMEMHLRSESREDMERMVNMGTVDGLQQAVGQIDGLLAQHRDTRRRSRRGPPVSGLGSAGVRP